MGSKHQSEELLALLFKKRKATAAEIGQALGLQDGIDQLLVRAQAEGHVRREGEGFVLTPQSGALAREMVRRERLAERLLKDLLMVSDEAVESTACEFEHILSEEVADSVCTLLGHPPYCPHGEPIPPGRCCEKHTTQLTPLVGPLTDLSVGGEGRIVFIGTRLHRRIDRLAGLGVTPGSVVRLHQKFPSVVLECGETSVALDPEVAREIFVKPTLRRTGAD